MNRIKEYLKTVAITLFIVTIGVCSVVFNVSLKAKHSFENTTEKVAARFINGNIKQLLEKAEKHPDDYTLNLKLAILYEQSKDFKTAEEQYRRALTKAPRSALALYRYALLCIGQNRFDEAILLVENITDSKEKSVILKKLLVYETMGDKLKDKGDYLNSAKMYNLSYKYAKILNKKTAERVITKLKNSYIRLADQEVSDNNYEQAALALESLLKLTDDPEARYKLALIYKPFNPKKCANQMEDLLDIKPEIVNLELYYSTLQELIDNAVANQDKKERDFYQHKQRKLKKFIIKNFVFSDEFTIEQAEFTSKSKLFSKKTFRFYIKNENAARTGPLLLMVKMKFPNSSSEEEKEVAISFQKDGKDVQKEFVEVPVDTNFTPGFNASNYVRVEISAKKNKRYDWVLLKHLNVLYKFM